MPLNSPPILKTGGKGTEFFEKNKSDDIFFVFKQIFNYYEGSIDIL